MNFEMITIAPEIKNIFIFTGVWTCSRECSLGLDKFPSDDAMLNHSIAATWSGLNLMARYDAVSEGDGHAMVSHWKHDMLYFWDKKLFPYLRTGHEFLASKY